MESTYLPTYMIELLSGTRGRLETCRLCNRGQVVAAYRTPPNACPDLLLFNIDHDLLDAYNRIVYFLPVPFLEFLNRSTVV